MNFTKAIARTFLIILILFAIPSCTNENEHRQEEGEHPTSVPTNTPVMTPAIASTPCRVVTPVRDGLPPQPQSKFIYILIDKSLLYSRYTRASLDITTQVLPKVLSLGDRVIVAWIGSERAPGVTFFGGSVRRVAPPILLAMPVLSVQSPTFPARNTTPTTASAGSPTPTAAYVGNTTPTPSSNEPTTKKVIYVTQTAEATRTQQAKTAEAVQTQQAKTAEAIQTQNAKTATAERSIAEYNCAILWRNQEVQRTMKEWEDQKRNAVNDFLKDAIPAIRNVKYQTDDESRIYEAIYGASEIFQFSHRNNEFQRYILLIFSNMQEKRSDHPGKLRFDFRNAVDIFVAMYSCERAQECQQNKDAWWDLFSRARARVIEFIPVIDTTEDRLIYLLGK